MPLPTVKLPNGETHSIHPTIKERLDKGELTLEQLQQMVDGARGKRVPNTDAPEDIKPIQQIKAVCEMLERLSGLRNAKAAAFGFEFDLSKDASAEGASKLAMMHAEGVAEIKRLAGLL